MRILRTVAAMTMVALAIGLVSVPADALIVLPQRTLHFSTAVTGTAKPYALEVNARLFGGSADVQVNLTRKATTGNRPYQQHSWYVNNIAFSCTNGTQRCELDTGTHMGAYGRIHLVFNATSQGTSSHHACPNNYHRENAQTVRTGKVTGDFHLVTGTAYFGTIGNHHSAPVRIPSSITAKADKISYGTACPDTSSKCARSVFAGIGADTQGTISATEFTSTGRGTALWNVTDVPIAADVTVIHRIFGAAHTAVLKVTSNSPSALTAINVKLPFSPFLTGHGTFTGSGEPNTVAYPGCRETDRAGTFTGHFAALLDGWGQYHAAGPLSVNASRYVPH